MSKQCTTQGGGGKGSAARGRRRAELEQEVNVRKRGCCGLSYVRPTCLVLLCDFCVFVRVERSVITACTQLRFFFFRATQVCDEQGGDGADGAWKGQGKEQVRNSQASMYSNSPILNANFDLCDYNTVEASSSIELGPDTSVGEQRRQQSRCRNWDYKLQVAGTVCESLAPLGVSFIFLLPPDGVETGFTIRVQEHTHTPPKGVGDTGNTDTSQPMVAFDASRQTVLRFFVVAPTAALGYSSTYTHHQRTLNEGNRAIAYLGIWLVVIVRGAW